MGRPRLTRLLVAPVALSTLVAGLTLAPAMAGTASADLSSQITSAKAQLAKLQASSEVAAENYDAGRIKLDAANRTAAQMQAKAAASAQRLKKAKESVAAIAALAYSQGATSDTTMLYQSSDPAGFVDRAALVDSMSRNDASVLAAVAAAQLDATTTQRAAAQAVAAAKAVVAELARDKSQVETAASQESGLLDKLVAQRQEQIRQAEIALAKARAEKKAAAIKAALAQEAAAKRAAADLERQRLAHQRAAEAFAQQKSHSSDSTSGSSDPGSGSSDTGSSSSSGSSGSGSGSGDTGSSGSVGSGSGDSKGSGSSGSGSGSSGSGSSGGASGSVGGGGSDSGSSAAQIAVDWAHRELGKAYVWGASGPNHFDCSGLTMYVYEKAGIYLPHSSGAQFGSGRHVSRGDLRPGDLVFFGSPIHHVGIYIGGGDMIEAPESGYDVRVAGAFRGDYVGAVRVSG